MKKFLRSQSGFTLMEVMIALTIFSIFITVYSVSQGYNISDSTTMKEEIILERLCENILNNLITDPPEFTEALTLSKTTKSFEKEYSDYEYTIEYKRLELPDLKDFIAPQSEDSDESAADREARSKIVLKVLEELKKHVKEAIWKVKVTTRHKETDFKYTLSTWLSNDKAKVKISF